MTIPKVRFCPNSSVRITSTVQASLRAVFVTRVKRTTEMHSVARGVFVGIFLLVVTVGSACAQRSVVDQCSGANGKALACCKQVVTANA